MRVKLRPIGVLARSLDNARLNDLLERMRTSTGNHVIYRQGAVRRVLKTLAAGEGVAMLIDQHMHSPDAIWVNFFRRPAATTSTLAALALRTGAAVIPVFAHPLPGGRYRFVYESPVQPPEGDGPDAIREFTQRCTDVLEMHVRTKPRPVAVDASPLARCADAGYAGHVSEGAGRRRRSNESSDDGPIGRDRAELAGRCRDGAAGVRRHPPPFSVRASRGGGAPVGGADVHDGQRRRRGDHAAGRRRAARAGPDGAKTCARLQRGSFDTAILFPNSFGAARDRVEGEHSRSDGAMRPTCASGMLTRAIPKPHGELHQRAYYQALTTALGIPEGPPYASIHPDGATGAAVVARYRPRSR